MVTKHGFPIAWNAIVLCPYVHMICGKTLDNTHFKLGLLSCVLLYHKHMKYTWCEINKLFMVLYPNSLDFYFFQDLFVPFFTQKKMDKQKAMLHSNLWLIELIYSLPVFWLSFTGKHKVVFVHVNPFLSSVLFCHCTILCLNGFYLGQLLEV